MEFPLYGALQRAFFLMGNVPGGVGKFFARENIAKSQRNHFGRALRSLVAQAFPLALSPARAVRIYSRLHEPSRNMVGLQPYII